MSDEAARWERSDRKAHSVHGSGMLHEFLWLGGTAVHMLCLGTTLFHLPEEHMQPCYRWGDQDAVSWLRLLTSRSRDEGQTQACHG